MGSNGRLRVVRSVYREVAPARYAIGRFTPPERAAANRPALGGPSGGLPVRAKPAARGLSGPRHPHVALRVGERQGGLPAYPGRGSAGGRRGPARGRQALRPGGPALDCGHAKAPPCVAGQFGSLWGGASWRGPYFWGRGNPLTEQYPSRTQSGGKRSESHSGPSRVRPDRTKPESSRAPLAEPTPLPVST